MTQGGVWAVEFDGPLRFLVREPTGATVLKRRASAVQSVQDPSLARCHCLSAITGVPFPSLSCHLFLAAEHSGGGGGGKCMPEEEEEEEEHLFIATKNQSVGYRAQGVGCRVGCVCACLDSLSHVYASKILLSYHKFLVIFFGLCVCLKHRESWSAFRDGNWPMF